jgi:hypothetical protein
MSYASDVIDALNEELPGQNPELIRLYALLVLAWGEGTTSSDVHDAWAVFRASTNPDHPALVPFDSLDEETQKLDEPYVEAIWRVAVKVGPR